MKLVDDKYCIACGSENPIGLHLDFEISKDKKSLKTEFTFEKKYQGYSNVVHGGMIFLVLDEVMVNAPLKIYNKPVVSVEITIRFKKSLEVNKKVIFTGTILKEAKNIIYTQGEAKLEDGSLIASALGKCFMFKAN